MIKINDLKETIVEKVDLLANAVRTTLGPCGANVIINSGLNTKITKDGISVARAIKVEQKDPIIDIMLQIAERTGTDAGDGTTSSTIFAQALIHTIYREMADTTNLLAVKRYLDVYKKSALEYLTSCTHSVKGNTDLYNIANISSNGDDEISKLVVEIVNKTGLEGMTSLKDSETSSTYVQYTEGLKWNSGYLSPNFITGNMECELNNVRVEIYNDKLTSLEPVIKTMDTCSQHNIPLLLAVKDIEYDVLNTIIYNQIKGNLKVCVIKIPGHGLHRQDYIDDLKAIIGTKEVIDRVLVTKHQTLFINKAGNEESKSKRISDLRIRMTFPDENIEDLRNRITNINNGYATVYVGGDSPVEIKEKIDRFEDAICAVKSALDEGIVVGGGNTLRSIAQSLTPPIKGDSDEMRIAFIAMVTACYSIIEQLQANYLGIKNYEYSSLNLPEGYIGYEDGKMVMLDNPIERGLIDPAKVIRLIIENGVSVAGTLITTKCLIIDNESGCSTTSLGSY